MNILLDLHVLLDVIVDRNSFFVTCHMEGQDALQKFELEHSAVHGYLEKTHVIMVFVKEELVLQQQPQLLNPHQFLPLDPQLLYNKIASMNRNAVHIGQLLENVQEIQHT
jgi:hypothetical protein